MNAYDFDDTIYAGESIYDFFFFCLKKDWFLIIFAPIIIFRLIQYKLNRLNIDKIRISAERIINTFFKHRNCQYDKLVDDFWKKNIKKIKPEFIQQLKEDDLIITGCPSFLLNGIKDMLKTKNIICTEFNLETKTVEFICFGSNKVKAFKEKYPDVKIDKFYTDSLADIPFMEQASEVYFVKGNKVKLIDKSKYL